MKSTNSSSSPTRIAMLKVEASPVICQQVQRTQSQISSSSSALKIEPLITSSRSTSKPHTQWLSIFATRSRTRSKKSPKNFKTVNSYQDLLKKKNSMWPKPKLHLKMKESRKRKHIRRMISHHQNNNQSPRVPILNLQNLVNLAVKAHWRPAPSKSVRMWIR